MNKKQRIPGPAGLLLDNFSNSKSESHLNSGYNDSSSSSSACKEIELFFSPAWRRLWRAFEFDDLDEIDNLYEQIQISFIILNHNNFYLHFFIM